MYPPQKSIAIYGLLGLLLVDFWSGYENVLPHKKIVDDSQGKVLLCKIDHHLILKINLQFFLDLDLSQHLLIVYTYYCI
jgi:hypothetical protein